MIWQQPSPSKISIPGARRTPQADGWVTCAQHAHTWKIPDSNHADQPHGWSNDTAQNPLLTEARLTDPTQNFCPPEITASTTGDILPTFLSLYLRETPLSLHWVDTT